MKAGEFLAWIMDTKRTEKDLAVAEFLLCGDYDPAWAIQILQRARFEIVIRQKKSGVKQ